MRLLSLLACALLAWGALTQNTPAEDMKASATLKGHSAHVWAVAFSPDGKSLASASEDKTARIWDVHAAKERLALKTHAKSIMAIAWSPDGKTLASGSMDKTIKLWDAATGKEKATFRGHMRAVLSLAFSPDGKTLASGSDDKTIRLWDLAKGKERAVLDGHINSITALAFTRDGKTLASAGWDKNVILWDMAKDKQAAALRAHGDRVTCVAFAPDGATLASSSLDKTVILWNVAEHTIHARLNGHTGEVTSVAYSPDGKVVASGSTDKTIRLWDVAAEKAVASIQADEKGEGIDVAFAPDGKTLVSGASDGTLRIWEVIAESLAAREDQKKLQGSWKVVSVEKDGKPLPAGEAREDSFVFALNRMTIVRKDDKEEAAIHLDPAAKPSAFDMTLTSKVRIFGQVSERKGDAIKGIYSLDGNTLKLCLNLGTGDRPTELATGSHPTWIMFVLSRQADPAQSQLAAARQAYEAFLNQYKAGEMEDVERLYRWSCRWLDVQRSGSERKTDHVAAVESHLTRMTALEGLIKEKDKAAKSPDLAAAEFYRLEAEHLLMDAKKK